MSRKVGQLRTQANDARERGDHTAALSAYLDLEKLRPDDGEWSKRAADCYRRLNDGTRRLDALLRATNRYNRSGFLLKAVAVCKLVLSIDPDHTATQQQLAELHSRRRRGVERTSGARGEGTTDTPEKGITPAPALPDWGNIDLAPAPTPATPAQPEPANLSAADLPADRSSSPGRRSIPPGAALETVELNAVVPGATRFSQVNPEAVIYEIPLDEIELIEEPPQSDSDPGPSSKGEILGNVPLFSELDEASSRALIDRVKLIEGGQGDRLFEVGDPATTLYVIAEGRVALVSPGPPRVELGQLEEGEFFGLMGLLTDQRRAAEAVLLEDSELLSIDRNVLGELVAEHPSVLTAFLRFVRERLIHKLVLTSPLFAPFIGGEGRALASRFRFLELDRGAVLIEQSKMAPGLFILLSGEAEAVRSSAGEQHQLATLSSGDLCGEMSLLSQEPAIASVIARTKCFALELDARDFRELIMTHPQVLIFVGDLAEERRRHNAAILSGEVRYSEPHVELL